MTGVLKTVLWSLLAASLLGLMAAGLLLGTPQGARLLLSGAERLSGGDLRVESVSGHLLDELELSGIHLILDGRHNYIGRLYLRWRPTALWRGLLHVQALQAQDVALDLPPAGPEKAPDGPVFEVPRLPLDLRLDALELARLSVKRDAQEPVLIRAFSARASLTGGRVRLPKLELESADGALSGTAEAGLTPPFEVRAQLAWHWRFSVTGPLQGELKLRGDSRRLTLQHLGRGALPLHLDLALEDVLGAPSWNGRLHWPAFEPPPETGVVGLRLDAGELRSEGGLDAYHLALTLGHSGAGLPPIAWALNGRGDSRQVSIEELRLDLLGGRIEGSARVDWRPGLAADLRVTANGLDLREYAPQLPPGLNAELALGARRSGQALVLDSLLLRLPDADAQLRLKGELAMHRKPAVTAELAWTGLRWPLQGQAQAASPSGALSVQGSADAYRGELEATVHAAPLGDTRLQLAAGGNREGLRIERLEARLLQGAIRIAGDLDWKQGPGAELRIVADALQPAGLLPDWPAEVRLSAEGGLDYRDGRLSLRQLQVRPSPGAARLTLDGWMRPADDPLDSPMDLHLDWTDLRWPLREGPALGASPKGELSVDGTPNAYRLKGALELAGAGVPPGRWSLISAGDTRALKVEALRGQVLSGALELAGDLAWSPNPQWGLGLEGSQLDPSGLLPELPGSLDLEGRISGSLDPKGRLVADLTLKRLQGKLLGRPLKASGKVAAMGDSYRVQGLRLDSGSNSARLDGSLKDRKLDLNWSLAVPSPGTLLPGAAGSLSAKGWIGGSLEQPAARANLEGAGLVFDGLRLQAIQAQLDTRLAAQAPLKLHMDASGLERDGDALLQKASLRVDGRMDPHRLELDLKAPGRTLSAGLEGGLDLVRGDWRGSLQSLRLDARPLGGWSLVRAAPLALAADRLALGEACLQQVGSSGRLCAALSRDADGKAAIQVDLRQLAVKTLNAALGGSLSASLTGSLAADGRLQGQARADLTEGGIRVQLGELRRRLEHRGGSLEATLNDAGLSGRLLLNPMAEGRIEAQLALPALTRLPLAPEQPVSGRLLARLPDLSPVQVFVPQLANTRGSLEADLELYGQLPLPGIRGTLGLRDAATDVPAIGLELRDLALQLSADPDTPGRWLLSGGAQSGAGRMRLQGGGGIDGAEAQLLINGSDFSVVNTPDARVRIAPDLQLDWNGEWLKVRGQLAIPSAAITPQLSLAGRLGGDVEQPRAPGSAILPSTDVVLLGAEGEPPAPVAAEGPARPLDSRVDILLGDAVRVDAVGFSSRIAGELTLINPPGQRNPLPLAKGLLSLEDGSYRSFGQDLEIEFGQLIFNGGPVTDPELNLRAVRWIRNDDQVSAVGVQLSGTLDAPRLDLFSEPQLDDQAIQSYLLTGKGPDSNQRMLSVGAQVHKDVYVGYGVNLLEGTHEFNLRYDILRWFGLEANVGEADKSVTFSHTLER